MKLRFVTQFGLLLFGLLGFAEIAMAQDDWPPYPSSNGGEHDIVRGPGGYFSVVKIGLLVLVFLAWVKLTDWMNRDAILYSEHTGMTAEVWNPISVGAFVLGLLAVFFVPHFLGGFPIYLALALLPWGLYALQRRGQIPDDAKTGEMFGAPKTEAGVNVPIKLTAAGRNSDESQGNLIRARQSELFPKTCEILHNVYESRTEQVLLDFTRDQVTHRIQVDGLWHQLESMDRETGDGVLWVMKTLAALNPAERRQTQKNSFNAKVGREKMEFELSSQGVKTGERVLLKLQRQSAMNYDLQALGMTESMQSKLLEKVDSDGMVIISAPVGQGLTTSWHGVLEGADRFTRDFVGIVDHDDQETERENIGCERFDSRQGESPIKLLQSIILKEPSAFAVPKLVNAEMIDLLADQAFNAKRTVVTRLNANSAIEAFLKLVLAAGDRETFVKGVGAVTCQRLVRKLCDKCRQPVQPNPQAIQQMGGNPQVHQVLYRDYQLPPEEARIDEQGRPVKMEPCAKCSGIGFLGRIAIYELLLVDNDIRAAVLKAPKEDYVTQVARKKGHKTLIQEAYMAVLEGRTSVAEVQRVFQQKPAQAKPPQARPQR